VFRDVQVAQGQQNGGGGGGEGEISEELADLFELELDRLSNQYEEVQRGTRQEVDNAIDETLEKLRELARRQQQENERMRARAQQQGGTQAGPSGRSQRQLADEAEEVARQLERLSREESLPDLAETAQKLREAAEEMRRAAASGEQSGVRRAER
jgi:DNA repair exonuclease SbcCD ATPase subunit